MSEQAIQALVLVVAGYLIGSLPMGVIVARLTGGVDPRTVGSGRTGGTNALRAMGARRAVVVGLADVAKGAVPILVANAVGLIVAALVLDDVQLDATSFVVAVVIFTIVFALLQPFLVVQSAAWAWA